MNKLEQRTLKHDSITILKNNYATSKGFKINQIYFSSNINYIDTQIIS